MKRRKKSMQIKWTRKQKRRRRRKQEAHGAGDGDDGQHSKWQCHWKWLVLLRGYYILRIVCCSINIMFSPFFLFFFFSFTSHSVHSPRRTPNTSRASAQMHSFPILHFSRRQQRLHSVHFVFLSLSLSDEKYSCSFCSVACAKR